MSLLTWVLIKSYDKFVSTFFTTPMQTVCTNKMIHVKKWVFHIFAMFALCWFFTKVEKNSSAAYTSQKKKPKTKQNKKTFELKLKVPDMKILKKINLAKTLR